MHLQSETETKKLFLFRMEVPGHIINVSIYEWLSTDQYAKHCNIYALRINPVELQV